MNTQRNARPATTKMTITTLCGAAMLGALVALAPGCGARNNEPVGTQAIATGHDVNAAAPSNGTVYVYDKTGDQVIYTGRVNKGDNVSVDPEKGTVALNGSPATQHTLRLDHQYEIRFRNEP